LSTLDAASLLAVFANDSVNEKSEHTGCAHMAPGDAAITNNATAVHVIFMKHLSSIVAKVVPCHYTRRPEMGA